MLHFSCVVEKSGVVVIALVICGLCELITSEEIGQQEARKLVLVLVASENVLMIDEISSEV